MKKLLLNGKAVPRWIILLIDLVITSWSFSLSYFIIKQFELSEIARGHFLIYTGIYCAIATVVFYFMRVHTGLIRYSNMQDIFRIFSAVLVSSLVYPVVMSLLVEPVFSLNSLNIAGVLLINFFISSSLLIMLRMAAKGVYFYLKRVTGGEKKRVLIYGSDKNAILVKQALEASNKDNFTIVGFVDTDRHKINSYIEQKRVYHIKSLGMVKHKLKVDKLVLMNEQMGARDKKVVIERSLRLGLQVLTVPPSDQWLYGRLKTNQIQDLKIEDLLQREPIVIDKQRISEEIAGKRVLITGAAGSIGSEIVRQVLGYNPATVILCDQAESPLHDIQLEAEERYPGANIVAFIADINNFKRMYEMFDLHRPEIIYHAAAYKHVPMMERNPREAILANVLGTKNIADLAVLFDAQKFVMVSTDKAVNPTNIMGATKRIAEIYIQSLNNYSGRTLDLINTEAGFRQRKALGSTRTKFVTTRFGNVLGSNGSVIPRFRQQIQQGKAITVTHPEITRYFMTIPEAVQLVMEAGAVGQGGEIFIFDMGKPVKIVDLARKMIKLAGLEPDVDIRIEFTGLRPGEKLYEELLNEAEKTGPTHHEKIKIARVITYSYLQVLNDIVELYELHKADDDFPMVRKMKEIVPEFKSKNSKYETLDIHLEDVQEGHLPAEAS